MTHEMVFGSNAYAQGTYIKYYTVGGGFNCEYLLMIVKFSTFRN